MIVISKTMDQIHECQLCHKTFKKALFLRRHAAAHSTERRYLCTICGKSYKYSKGLNRHCQNKHGTPKRAHLSGHKLPNDWMSFLVLNDNQRYEDSQIYVTSACPIIE